ncbi:MAG: hypothetical protein ACM3YM_06230 [Sphingomonadales bacterium]
MRKMLLTASLFFVVPAAAQAAGPYHVTADGADIEYNVTTLPDGVRKLAGIDHRTGERFELLANRRYVWGTFGASQVSFPVPAQKKIKAVPVAKELASN